MQGIKYSAVIRPNAGLFLVIFGQMDGTEFRVSHGKSSRSYKTGKGAQRAASKWEAEGK